MKSSSVLLLCIALAIATVAQAEQVVIIPIIQSVTTIVSIKVQKTEGTFVPTEFENAVSTAYGGNTGVIVTYNSLPKRATSEEGTLSFTGEDSKTWIQASRFVTNMVSDYTFELAEITTFAAPSANKCPSSNDDACSKATNGVCYDAGKTGSGFCSCLSGFSGPQCATAVAGYQTPLEVEEGAFNPVFDWNTEDEDFVFTVTIPSVKASALSSVGATVFSLGDGVNTCGYPVNTNWEITSGSGNDIYKATFSFEDLKSCGLYELTDSPDYTQEERAKFYIYRGPISIERDFKINTLLGTNPVKLTRKSSLTRNYDFQFPKELNIETSVHTIENSGLSFSSLTDSKYDIAAKKWTFTFTAVTQFPYQLEDAGESSITGTSASRVRTTNGLSLTCANNEATDNLCVQTLVLEVVDCDAVSFTGNIVFNFICITGKDCSTVSDPENSYVVLKVSTSEACPVQHEVKPTETLLKVYSDLALSDPRTQFGLSENIYFAAAFNPVGRPISGVTVDSVCYTPKGNQECVEVSKDSFQDVLPNSPSMINNEDGKSLALQNVFHVAASKFGKGEATISATYSISYGTRKRSETKTFQLNSLKASFNIVGKPAGKPVALLDSATPASEIAHVPSTSSQQLASLLAVTLVVVALIF